MNKLLLTAVTIIALIGCKKEEPASPCEEKLRNCNNQTSFIQWQSNSYDSLQVDVFLITDFGTQQVVFGENTRINNCFEYPAMSGRDYQFNVKGIRNMRNVNIMQYRIDNVATCEIKTLQFH